MLPRVLAHDPGTASYHVYLLFYVAGFLTAQGSGGQFPCPCFEGTTQTAHISPPYVAVEPGWVAPWPDFVEKKYFEQQAKSDESLENFFYDSTQCYRNIAHSTPLPFLFSYSRAGWG